MIAETNRRLESPVGRVKSPLELLDHRGKTMFVVLSQYHDGKRMFYNSSVEKTTLVFFEWHIGSVEDQFGHELNSEDCINDKFRAESFQPRYLVYDFNDNQRTISCRDFNISPNWYNSHVAFLTWSDLEAYAEQQSQKYGHNFEPVDISKLPFYVDYTITRDEVERVAANEEGEAAA